MNALKHGLTAATLIIASENAEDFDELRAALVARFRPRCVLEAELVERVAATCWRLRRVPAFEAAILHTREVQCAQISRLRRRPGDEASGRDELRALGEALIHDSQFGDTLRKLGRHETTLMNVLDKTMQTLAELQLRDREEETPALRAAA